MRYTVLAYFYMDCQSKVGLNVAICISAYYGEKNVANRCSKMARQQLDHTYTCSLPVTQTRTIPVLINYNSTAAEHHRTLASTHFAYPREEGQSAWLVLW